MIDKGTFGTLKALYHTFGCKLNFAETSTVAKTFAGAGITRVSGGETPDIIVINTCSVTELADKKCRQTIRSFHRRYPKADILVTGCYAQLKPEEVASLEGVAIVAGNDRKGELTAFLDEWLASRSPRSYVQPAADMHTFTPSCSRGDRTRYFLKVQDGCDYWCTYCTIPAARGRSRSGTVEQMVAQAREAAANGGKEIVITGVNIGDFGKRVEHTALDGTHVLEKGTETFLDLIRELDKVEGIERYRISSIEPNLLTDEIIEFCARSRRFMPHFHIPLQCGSDEVLRLMHRHYEFEKSREFLRGLPITRLHIFPYSERPGTKALSIEHTVSQEEKHRRVNEMLHISEEKMRQFASQFIGTVRPVLLEHGKPGAPMSGFTDNYLKVSVEAPASLDNTIVGVRLLELLPTDIGDCHVRGELAPLP